MVLDNFTNSTPAVLTRLEALSGRPVPCVNADIRDVVALRAAFHDHPIAAVVHCAGLKTIAESEERPLAFYDVNVGGAADTTAINRAIGLGNLALVKQLLRGGARVNDKGGTTWRPAASHRRARLATR